jgi:hypothetical protein
MWVLAISSNSAGDAHHHCGVQYVCLTKFLEVFDI